MNCHAPQRECQLRESVRRGESNLQKSIEFWRQHRPNPGFKYLLALILLLATLGNEMPFEPYDWVQQSVTPRLNTKPYRGDAVIIAVDQKTIAALGRKTLNGRDLAKLVTNVERAKPEQILIDRLPLALNAEEDRKAIATSFSQLRSKPVMFVELFPKESTNRDQWTSGAYTNATAPLIAQKLDPSIAPFVVPAHSISWSSPTGAPFGLPMTVFTNDGPYPSLSQLLADQPQPVFRKLYVDQSYDPASVVVVSALDILSGKFDRRLIENRRLVISTDSVLVRDRVRAAQGNFVPRAAVIVFGGQSLLDGPPRLLGWIPAFLLAAAAVLAWSFMRRPWGRIVALATLLLIVVSPLFLERYLIFQETSNGVILMILVALARLWSNFRATLALSRSAAQTKSWFLAQASHDLRQPIHAIGMLSARLSQTELSPTQAELVAKIDRSVEGASRMFQSLLDIATIESGTLKPRDAAISVNELLAEIEGQNALAAESAGVNLRFVPSELIIITDRVLAVTMLQNIVANAIKYASGKRVLIGCRRVGSTASLCVYDRGSGISREDMRHVKKDFFRAASRTGMGGDGTGLGLAIVHRLSLLLNLKFSLRSTPGKGTAAIISGFKLTRVASKTVPVESVAPRPLTGLRVILADDDVDSLRATEALLEQWGCHVAAHEQFPPSLEGYDVIISDFDFGHGKTLADHQVAIHSFSILGGKAIVVSGHHPEIVKRAMKQSSMLVLAKPVRPAELRSVLMATKMANATI